MCSYIHVPVQRKGREAGKREGGREKGGRQGKGREAGKRKRGEEDGRIQCDCTRTCSYMFVHVPVQRRKEGGREGGREGGKKGGREERKEGGREGGREEGREGGRRKGEREREQLKGCSMTLSKSSYQSMNLLRTYQSSVHNNFT